MCLCFTAMATRQSNSDGNLPAKVPEYLRTRWQAAIHTVQPLTRGRLPILDGFVIPQGQPLESYSRAYYECTLQILPGSSGQNIVRAVAKITAWYTDPEASRSGYRVLPSNGRLENDALDRIDEALADATVGVSSGSFSSSVKGANSAPIDRRNFAIDAGMITPRCIARWPRARGCACLE